MRLRLRDGAASDVVAVLGSFVVLGALSGAVWWLLVHPAEFTVTRHGPEMGELDLSRRFAVDGWYSVVAVVAGFGAGVGLTWWRSRDFRLTTVLVVVGAFVAAAVTAYVGGLLGPEDSDAVLAGAGRGDTVPVELTVSTLPVYLMWPVSVLAGALMVLWSSSRVEPLAEGSSENPPRGPH